MSNETTSPRMATYSGQVLPLGTPVRHDIVELETNLLPMVSTRNRRMLSRIFKVAGIGISLAGSCLNNAKDRPK